MSYGGYNGPRHGGGGRRRGGGGGGGPRHHHPPPERPEVKIKRAIIKFGDSDDPTPVDELSRAAEYLRDKLPADASAVAQGFKIGICEEPHKIPYYATLLAIVSSGTLQEDSSASGAANLTRPVLEDLFRAFQASLDALAWRDIRFFTLFFSHLTNLGMINSGSIVALMQSFTAVLDEPGVSQSRATNASRCVGEGLVRAGSVLHSSHSEAVTDLVTAVRTYHSSISDATRALFHPLPSISLSSTPAQSEKAHELLSSLLTSLDLLAQDNWALPVCIPQPETESSVIPQILRLAPEDRMDVPSVLVPPEVEGEEKVGEETGVEWWIRMYDDELTPSPATPLGYTLRTLFIDMINIYEVNRKEGARILMEVHRWLSIGTFRPADDREATGIVLQNCLIEAVLSQLFHVPRSTLKLMYHAALINELCKLSPQTVGPAVGKSFRKMYSLLASPDPVEDGAAGLDVQLAHLFAEWFALHMSNFGFAWVWKEWVPDLELPAYHPKRGLMRRVVDYETRLAYYDRIAKTLPGPMVEPETGILPAQPPGPAYAYEAPDHPHHQEAAELLAMIKGRAKSDEVAAHCLQLPRSVPLQHMVMQSLLQVGSRSFSHFLNAVERYLPLLRGEAGSGASLGGEKEKDKARAILCAAGEYWARNSQMIGIVFDKLMQYQIVEPSDVIEYAFAVGDDEGTGLSAERWGLVEAALNKANGRVVGAKRKVNTLNKDEEDRRARAIANAGGMGMDADGDGDTQLAEPDMPASQSLVTAQKALEALLKDQKKVFQSAITGFVGALSKAGIPSLAPAGEWGQKEWGAWESWGWYRQFCRAYVPQLRMFADALEVDRATDVGSLMAKTWDTALGYET